MTKNFSFILIAGILLLFSCDDELTELPLRNLEYSFIYENSALADSLFYDSESITPGESAVFNYYSQFANHNGTEILEYMNLVFELDLESSEEFSFSGDLNALTNLQINQCVNRDCTNGYIPLQEGTISGTKHNDSQWSVIIESNYIHNNVVRGILVASIFEVQD